MITPDERAEFIALCDRIEKDNVRRLEALTELSRLRGVPVPQIMTELGIAPHAAGEADE